MILHLFRLIWNKKKQNFLLTMELLISFLVLFAVFSLLVYYYQNYRRPIGIDYEGVISVNYAKPDGMINKDSIQLFNESLTKQIKSMPEVEELSLAEANIPFSMSTHNSDVADENAKIRTMSDIFTVGDDYQKLLHISMAEGRWFSKEDLAWQQKPVVISQSLSKALFGSGSAVGQRISGGGIGGDQMKLRIVGVTNDLKFKGDYQEPQNSVFMRLDTSSLNSIGAILIRVKPNADASFESRLYKIISNAIRNSSIEIEHLTTKRTAINNFTLVPTIILLIVAGFLIINVALGIFGVLWYNINKRKSEIGLRRAVGASAVSISSQLVTEAMVLTMISMLLGLFFAVQFPLLNVFNLPARVYVIAMVMAVVFIFVLVILCALYPGKEAARIYPSAALHEE